jgi:hypothetical protein
MESSAKTISRVPDGISHQMQAILKKADGQAVSLGSIIVSLSQHSHAMLVVFLSFPLCLPVGIPVLTTTLGLTLSLVGFLLAMGCKV